MHEFQPNIIALQETKLPPNISYNIKKYNLYSKNRNSDGGGVALYVNNVLPSSPLPLQTNLEAIATRVWYKDKNITFCSLYLPPGVDFPTNDFISLLNELPSPFMILGDFNSKNNCWGSPTSTSPSPDITYKRGSKLLEILEDKSLQILNTGKPTFFRAYNNYFSHLDLTIGSPEICHHFNWDTHWNTSDSDHFPIIISNSLNNLYSQKPAKWDFKKTSTTDWNLFSASINIPPITEFSNSTEAFQGIVDHILEVAQQHIKTTSTNINSKYFNPWWNTDCALAIKEKKKKLRTLNKKLTPENLLAFQRASAKCRWIIKNAKKNSWNKFVSTINRFTPVKTIWNKIRKIDNKTYNPSKIILKKDNQFIIDPQDITTVLGEHFGNVSSDDNYSDEFRAFKNAQERIPIFFEEANQLFYNKPITIHDFLSALDPTKNSLPGEDDIPYEIYKHLSITDQMKLVDFLNHIWLNHDFPEQWRNAHVIPLLKPTKPQHDPNSYRPISLTIALGKLMEKIIANRLMAYLIEHKIIVDYQFGFQKNKSTLDPLVQLDYAIRNTIIEDEYLVVVFLDLEKAYDMVWAFGLLQDLVNIGLKGNLPIFISNFLQNRTIQVKINDFISNKFKLENGLPQGSILSVFLFLIVINNLFQNCDQTVNKLFCDDGMFWSKNLDLSVAEQSIQNTLDKLTNWSNHKGLKFSTLKSCYIIFTHKNTRDLNLKLLNQNLPRSYQVKYLGIIFDHRLTWKPHILNIKEKCFKRLNVLKCVSHKKWGSDRKTLKMLYLSLIQSKMNYASFLFTSAHHSVLEILDKVQYAGIRVVVGAMYVTRTAMLEAESLIMPLDLRRQALGLSYLGRTARLESSITRKLLTDHYNFQFYEWRRKPRPWLATAHSLIQDIGINYGSLSRINPQYFYIKPKTKVKFTMHIKKKEEYTEIEARSKFMEMLAEYMDYFPVFTDGSVMEERTGCAVIIRYVSYKYRLPNNTNIFIAELLAVSRAIEKINDNAGQKFLICCDSLSVLQAIKGGTPNFLVHKIYDQLTTSTKEICFEWVPSHLNIPGNNQADEMARKALDLEEIQNLPLDYSDYKIQIQRYLKDKWQNQWDERNEGPNETRLYKTKPVLQCWSSSDRKSRQEEVILARLRLGTCLFNKKHIIPRENHLMCQQCQVDLTPTHLIIDCPGYSLARTPITNYLNREGLPIAIEFVLNDHFPHDLLFKFLKDTHFYNMI